MLFWVILPLHLFFGNQVRESSKQVIQATWSTSIYHLKWWISRFRGIYRVLVASEGDGGGAWGLFFILLKGFRPLCNITKSSVLVLVGVLICLCILWLLLLILLLLLLLLLILFLILISFLLFLLLLEFLSNAVYCLFG